MNHECVKKTQSFNVFLFFYLNSKFLITYLTGKVALVYPCIYFALEVINVSLKCFYRFKLAYKLVMKFNNDL